MGNHKSEVPAMASEYTRRGNPARGGHTLTWCLTHDDWSDLTASQIAEVLASTRHSVTSALSRLRRDGIEVAYRRDRQGRKEQKEQDD